ncbi:hypothetical protein [Uliginosibacterium flavum]|uniref:Plasmid recombination enzyme n=1 Tax=Uliginosibacterium flavum TaxID=1396831 RepID=A0ABV2TNS4_9RHOO
MSSCQFIHLEVYARVAGSTKKGGHNLDSIVAEAERHPSACLHVTKPRPPSLLYGFMPSKAAEKASAWAEHAFDSRGRRLRRDGLCLLAGVISLEQQRIEDWPAFRQATLKWLIDFFGDRLVSVIEHTDEENPHIHFYCVAHARERFECLHPGRKAAQEVRNAGQLKGRGNSSALP